MKYRIILDAQGNMCGYESFRDNKVPQEYQAIVVDKLPAYTTEQKDEMAQGEKRSEIARKVGEYFLDWVDNSTESLEDYLKSKVNAISISK